MVRATVMVTRLDGPSHHLTWEACLLATRNKGLSENTGRTSARCRHSATYLFVPSPTQLHARVI